MDLIGFADFITVSLPLKGFLMSQQTVSRQPFIEKSGTPENRTFYSII